MTNAPRAVLVFVPVPSAGNPEPLRRAKPIYPAKRADQRWPLNQSIPKYTPPADQLDAIRRQSREVLDQARSQRASHGR